MCLFYNLASNPILLRISMDGFNFPTLLDYFLVYPFDWKKACYAVDIIPCLENTLISPTLPTPGERRAASCLCPNIVKFYNHHMLTRSTRYLSSFLFLTNLSKINRKFGSEQVGIVHGNQKQIWAFFIKLAIILKKDSQCVIQDCTEKYLPNSKVWSIMETKYR